MGENGRRKKKEGEENEEKEEKNPLSDYSCGCSKQNKGFVCLLQFLRWNIIEINPFLSGIP